MKKVMVLAVTVLLFAGCAAFDKSSEPYEGFSQDEIPAPQGQENVAAEFTGYYAGKMTLDSNACTTVEASEGDAVDVAFDVVQTGQVVNVVFGKDESATGNLDGKNATMMLEKSGVKNVYYLKFEEGKLGGTMEVVEADESGQFAAPCATFSFDLTKGEKPAEKK